MPDALRTAVPAGDWRSFKFTCDVTGGLEGVATAQAADVLGDRHSYLHLVNDTVGILVEDADFGAEGVLIYEAEKAMLPKSTDSTDVFAVGDRIYWDPATELCTPNYDSAFYWIGTCTEPALATDLRVEGDLHGQRAEAEAVLP